MSGKPKTSDKTATSRHAFKPVSDLRESYRNLPHIQLPGSTYFVTFRTKDSDMPEVAREIVLSCCRFWDRKRMHLHACVVMPDHVHMLLTPLPVGEGEDSHSLSRILHSIKSYSANRVNALLGRTGAFWLDESYDRIIRSDEEYIEKWNYIRENAVRRGLVDGVDDYPYLYEEGK